MNLVLIGKGLLLEGSTPQTKDKQVQGIYIYVYTCVWYRYLQYIDTTFLNKHYKPKKKEGVTTFWVKVIVIRGTRGVFLTVGICSDRGCSEQLLHKFFVSALLTTTAFLQDIDHLDDWTTAGFAGGEVLKDVAFLTKWAGQKNEKHRKIWEDTTSVTIEIHMFTLLHMMRYKLFKNIVTSIWPAKAKSIGISKRRYIEYPITILTTHL